MALLHLFLCTLAITKVFSSPVEKKAEKITDKYRLPNIYSITSYDVKLTVPSAAFTSSSDAYTGTVTIKFTVTNKTDSITLHADHNFITVNKMSFDNANVESDSYSIDAETDILKISVSEVAAKTQHTLEIEFASKLSTKDMYGFYKSSYVDKDGVTKYLGTTQFEQTYARRAFPCFDEPAFKSVFSFTITFPSNMNVLFNMKAKTTTNNPTAGTTTQVFEATPIVSTYLIAFIVSEFTCTDGDNIGTVQYQVCSRKESADTRALSVEVGPKLLTVLNQYTGYNYATEMNKMDQVAIPDFAAGAMENWGLVTYRETALLWDPNESSNTYKQRVATVIAHEFSHQWFGNLVTMKWWSETFLNEGFARYSEYHITHEVFPEWELDKQFVIEQLQGIMSSDAILNAQALQSSCSTPAEISAKFGSISYNKGGSILRMVSHFMGVDNFKTGIKSYLSTHNHKNTEPEDLWTSLSSAVDGDLPGTLEAVMENWIKKSGFPLLTVTLNGNDIIITQERFLVSGTEKTTRWFVPISYTTSKDTSKFENTLPEVWMKPSDETTTITLPDDAQWVILNNQQAGYYKVNYDNGLWDKIKVALDKSDSVIPEVTRAQIVDDLFTLAQSSKIKYSKVFDVAGFLANDTSYYPWYPAFNGFSFLLRRVGYNSDLGKAISSHILQLMDKLYASVPIGKLKENDQIYTLNQVQTLTWACRLGNQICVDGIKTLFNNYKETGTRPNRNLRSIVYCNALRYSESSSDWTFLWERYGEAADLATEQVTLLSALGCTKDTTLLEEYLKKSITTGSGIRTQDALSVFSSVYAGNPEGVAVAFKFLRENYKAIAAQYNSMNSLNNLIKGIAERFTTKAEINELQNFIDNGELPEEFKTSAKEALETAEANLKWLETLESDLREYYNVSGAAGKFGISLIMLMLPLLVSKFFMF